MVKIIREKRIDNLQDIYDLALEIGFGCEDCLVVMDKDNIIFKGDEELDPLYREMFDNPSFNPRWKSGIADFVIILKIDNQEWIEE